MIEEEKLKDFLLQEKAKHLSKNPLSQDAWDSGFIAALETVETNFL